MRITDSDIEWLDIAFPNLLYNAEDQNIVGEMDFRACYDEGSGAVMLEILDFDDRIRSAESFIYDVFEIEIDLNSDSINDNGWPKVYETGGRHKKIAEEHNIDIEDLHIFTHDDGQCCLGIRYSYDRQMTLRRFLSELVVPFFYRLSYVGNYGIDSARSDLWKEYSHGNEGKQEYETEMLDIARDNPGRNDLCPCGSGRKYKKCCLDEVDAVEGKIRRRIKSGKPYRRALGAADLAAVDP